MSSRFESSGDLPHTKNGEEALSQGQWQNFDEAGRLQEPPEPATSFEAAAREASDRLRLDAIPDLGRQATRSEVSLPEQLAVPPQISAGTTAEAAPGLSAELLSNTDGSAGNDAAQHEESAIAGEPTTTGDGGTTDTGGGGGPPGDAPAPEEDPLAEANTGLTGESDILSVKEVTKLHSKLTGLERRLSTIDDVRPDLPPAVGALKDHTDPTKIAMSQIDSSAWQSKTQSMLGKLVNLLKSDGFSAEARDLLEFAR